MSLIDKIAKFCLYTMVIAGGALMAAMVIFLLVAFVYKLLTLRSAGMIELIFG